MRVGRVGVFQAPNGAVGMAAVFAILNSNQLVAKDAATGQLVRFNRGEIHIIDSCGQNSNAADLVRQLTGITVGGRDASPAQLSEAIDLANYNPGLPGAAPSGTVEGVTGDEVHLSPTVLQAIRQVVKAILHKKKPQPVQYVRGSRSTSKASRSTSKSAKGRSRRAKVSTSKGGSFKKSTAASNSAESAS